jgi:hypothetical protein
MCFSKVKLGLLNFEPDSELTLPEGWCFELFSVQSVIISNSVEVIWCQVSEMQILRQLHIIWGQTLRSWSLNMNRLCAELRQNVSATPTWKQVLFRPLVKELSERRFCNMNIEVGCKVGNRGNCESWS